MKGSNLGEFEELVLLVVGVLYPEAYAVAIQEELAKLNRTVTLSTVHVALHRLEEKAHLESSYGGATPERGGRRKLFFKLTRSGQQVIIKARDMRNHLWSSIPEAAFNMSYI